MDSLLYNQLADQVDHGALYTRSMDRRGGERTLYAQGQAASLLLAQGVPLEHMVGDRFKVALSVFARHALELLSGDEALRLAEQMEGRRLQAQSNHPGADEARPSIKGSGWSLA